MLLLTFYVVQKWQAAKKTKLAGVGLDNSCNMYVTLSSEFSIIFGHGSSVQSWQGKDSHVDTRSVHGLQADFGAPR